MNPVSNYENFTKRIFKEFYDVIIYKQPESIVYSYTCEKEFKEDPLLSALKHKTYEKDEVFEDKKAEMPFILTEIPQYTGKR